MPASSPVEEEEEGEGEEGSWVGEAGWVRWRASSSMGSVSMSRSRSRSAEGVRRW